MSFAGFYQVLCENGHLECFDAFAYYGDGKCRYCGAPHIWENLVDETNGSHYQGERIDGFVELEVSEEAPRCECCGQKTGKEVYKVPEDAGRIIRRE